jgi:hypothetical protein
MARGLAFNVNYTWSHSIDNYSAPTDNSGQFGGTIQNAFRPGQSRASSDFDLRHQLSANVTYDLPFGKNARYFSSAPGWMDQIIGGWRIGSLVRAQSGMPAQIQGTGIFPTNYWQSATAIPTGATIPSTGVYTNERGNPSLFQSRDAINAFTDEYPGQTGTRAIVRLPGVKNVDISVIKDFRLPWEGHALQFRAEAYNAFNFVNFNYSNGSGAGNYTSSSGAYSTSFTNLTLTGPTTFGEFTGTTPPRTLQLSLRYSF